MITKPHIKKINGKWVCGYIWSGPLTEAVIFKGCSPIEAYAVFRSITGEYNNFDIKKHSGCG